MRENEINVTTEEKVLAAGYKLVPNLTEKHRKTYVHKGELVAKFYIFVDGVVTKHFWLDNHQMEAVKTAWEMDAWSKIY